MPDPASVTITAPGDWPGTDPIEAQQIIRGELGSPNLPFLPSLPARGLGSDDIGRTAGLLSDLPVDAQPHGWRLVDRPGQDVRRAISALSSDLNALADAAGAEEVSPGALKVHCSGPLSMSANLHLHNGERALLDFGARRDIRDALAEGVGGLLRRAATANPGAQLVLQLDEPEITDVLGGTIPTSSGYRTLRSIAEHEVNEAWTVVSEAAREAGAAVVVLALRDTAPLKLVSRTPDLGFAVPLAAATPASWETIAGLVEDGREFWAGVPASAGKPLKAQEMAETVLRPWRGIGLAVPGLGGVRLFPATKLADHTPADARTILSQLNQGADALNQAIADA